MKYFAYGSNLLPARLQRRISSSRPLGVASIAGYQLRFHKLGADNSGKCNAFHTGRAEDILFGALYEIDAQGKMALDQIEGYGYHAAPLVVDIAGTNCTAYTYIAEAGYIRDRLQPFDWYKDYVFYGAVFHRFPASYVTAIDNVTSVADSNHQRADENRHVLRLALENGGHRMYSVKS